MNPQEDLYKIALTKIPHVGAVIAKNLISYCGSVEGVFSEGKRGLLKVPGVGEELATRIRDRSYLDAAELELEFVRSHQLRIYFYHDETYPRRLRPFGQSPILLYGKGNLQLNAPRVISIVGTRRPTEYGKRMCERIVQDLALYSPLVISGLAYGIDILAHRTSLAVGLPTIGILGSGFGNIYPRVHQGVAEKMMQNGGLLTEFSYTMGPEKDNFPARNRVVAAIADAVLVVESADRGGSMITAEFANGFNKDVFALPGRSMDPMSKGCNTLIGDHKAQLVTSAEDIAHLLAWDKKDEMHGQRQIFADLNERERLICELLQEKKERDIDSLSYFAKMKNSEISSVLLSLEFKGVIKALPGKRYSLI